LTAFCAVNVISFVAPPLSVPDSLIWTGLGSAFGFAPDGGVGAGGVFEDANFCASCHE
jgi:hypothetical protein